MATDQTSYVQGCLDRLRAGDPAAREELLTTACQRLIRLTRLMFQDFRRLKQWEETDDVFQSAMIRLQRALQTITPPSVRDFYRLAALQIRRELLDLARHHAPGRALDLQQLNPQAREDSQQEASPRWDPSDETFEPQRLAAWSAFHQRVEGLAEEEQEVFDLLWYQGLGHTEAATVLGVSARTVKRRWQAACLKLHEALGDAMPGLG